MVHDSGAEEGHHLRMLLHLRSSLHFVLHDPLFNFTGCMVYGVWCTVHGAWCMVYGIWCMVHFVCCMVQGVWSIVNGQWRMINGVGERERAGLTMSPRPSGIGRHEPWSATQYSAYPPPGVSAHTWRARI